MTDTFCVDCNDLCCFRERNDVIVTQSHSNKSLALESYSPRAACTYLLGFGSSPNRASPIISYFKRSEFRLIRNTGILAARRTLNWFTLITDELSSVYS